MAGDMAAGTVTGRIITNPMASLTAAGGTVITSDRTAMAAIAAAEAVTAAATTAGDMPSEPDREDTPPLSPQARAAAAGVAAMAAVAVTDDKLSVIAGMMPDLAAKNPIGPCGIEQYHRQQDQRSDQQKALGAG